MRKSVFDFDLILLSGRYDLELIKDSLDDAHESPEVIAAGVPLFDEMLVPQTPDRDYGERLGLDLDRPTVLFAPHWSTLSSRKERENDYFQQVLDELSKLDYNVVIKLHACSMIPAMGGSTKWAGRLQRLAGTGNFYVDFDFDDVPAIQFCDFLITDISSRAFIFMLLGKPVVMYNPIAPRLDQYNSKRLELLRNGSCVAIEPGDITRCLMNFRTTVETNPNANAIGELCFSNFGYATETAVRAITSELDLSAKASANPTADTLTPASL